LNNAVWHEHSPNLVPPWATTQEWAAMVIKKKYIPINVPASFTRGFFFRANRQMIQRLASTPSHLPTLAQHIAIKMRLPCTPRHDPQDLHKKACYFCLIATQFELCCIVFFADKPRSSDSRISWDDQRFPQEAVPTTPWTEAKEQVRTKHPTGPASSANKLPRPVVEGYHP